MHLPAQRRECRQASFDTDSQGLALAQDHPGAVRLGGDTNERLLSPSSILPHRARRGAKKAILAVAASILTAIYHMLKDGTFYQDLGPDHFDPRTKERHKNRLIKRLADLGYVVELVPQAS